MRFYFSRKIGNWRVGHSIKATPWNFLFLSLGYMIYYVVYLVVLLIEFVLYIYYLMFKYMWKFCVFVFHKVKNGILSIADKIKNSGR